MSRRTHRRGSCEEKWLLSITDTSKCRQRNIVGGISFRHVLWAIRNPTGGITIDGTMKYSICSPILLICCSLVPGALALCPRRHFALAEKVAQPHCLPAKFDVSVKIHPNVDGFETDRQSAFAGTSINSISDNILAIRGGASIVGVVMSPAFWLSE